MRNTLVKRAKNEYSKIGGLSTKSEICIINVPCWEHLYICTSGKFVIFPLFEIKEENYLLKKAKRRAFYNNSKLKIKPEIANTMQTCPVKCLESRKQ